MNDLSNGGAFVARLRQSLNIKIPDQLEDFYINASATGSAVFFGLLTPAVIGLNLLLGLTAGEQALIDIPSSLVIALAFTLQVAMRRTWSFSLRFWMHVALWAAITTTLVEAGRPLAHINLFLFFVIMPVALHKGLEAVFIVFIPVYALMILFYEPATPLSQVIDDETSHQQTIFATTAVLALLVAVFSLIRALSRQHEQVLEADHLNLQLLVRRERALATLANDTKLPLSNLQQELEAQRAGSREADELKTTTRSLVLAFGNALSMFESGHPGGSSILTQVDFKELLYNAERSYRALFASLGTQFTIDAHNLPMPHYMLDQAGVYRFTTLIVLVFLPSAENITAITLLASSERGINADHLTPITLTIEVNGEQPALDTLTELWFASIQRMLGEDVDERPKYSDNVLQENDEARINLEDALEAHAALYSSLQLGPVRPILNRPSTEQLLLRFVLPAEPPQL